MNKTFEERVEEAKTKILPILQEFQVEIGTEHFLKADATGAKNLLEFVDSRIKWVDAAPQTDTPEVVADVTPESDNKKDDNTTPEGEAAANT